MHSSFFHVNEVSLHNMITSVVREHHWLPSQVGSLFVDNIDHYGLEYWYNDVMKVTNELTATPKPK